MKLTNSYRELISIALGVLVLTGCDFRRNKITGDLKSRGPLLPTYASISRQIFEVRCLECHREGGQGKNVALEPLQSLLDSPRELVLPGNCEESGLWIALTRQDSKRMPPPDAGEALSAEELAVIEKWIQEGAKP